MVQAVAQPVSKPHQRVGVKLAVAVWLVAAVFYFLQYSLRSAVPPNCGGLASLIGVISFLNFTFSALLAPVFGGILQRVSSGAAHIELSHYQLTFLPLLFGVAIAIILALILRETGSAVRQRVNSSD